MVFPLVQGSVSTNIHRGISGSKGPSSRLSRDLDRVLIEIQDQGKGIAKRSWHRIQIRAGGGLEYEECENDCGNSRGR